MNSLLRTDLFMRLSEYLSATNKTMESAYVQFIDAVKILNQKEIDSLTSLRRLSMTRIEFIFLEYELKKNALKYNYCKKTILFLELEIDLLKLTFQQSNRSSYNDPQDRRSNLYFIPKSNGIGIIGITEYALSLSLSNEFFDEAGRPASLMLISNVLEQAFNFSFRGIYKRQTEIFKRKSYNTTKALDYLRSLIIRKYRKRKDEKR